MAAPIPEEPRQIGTRPAPVPPVAPEPATVDPVEYGCVDWYRYDEMRIHTESETLARVIPCAAAPSSA